MNHPLGYAFVTAGVFDSAHRPLLEYTARAA